MTEDQIRPHRSRVRRIAAWTAGIILGVPLTLVVLVLAVVLIGANIGPGQRLIARKAHDLTGGMVTIDGFGGRFPDALHVGRVTISDARGPWLTLDGLTLDWSPLSLMHEDARIGLLSADRIEIARKPLPSTAPAQPAKPSNGKSSLPNFAVDLGRLRVGRIEIAHDVAGVAGVFSLDGHAHIASIAPFANGVSLETLPVSDLGLDLRRLDAPGGLQLTARTPERAVGVHLAVTDGVAGYVTSVAHMTQFDPASIALDLNGPRDGAALKLAVGAGAVHVGANGTLDLLHTRGDLALDASAPAMTPTAGVSWNSIALNAHIHGDLKAPAGQGTLTISDLAASGAGASGVTLAFDGQETEDASQTRTHLHLTAEGLRLPGPQPTLLAASPLVADVVAFPNAPTRPVTLSVTHPLLQLAGQADTKPAAHGAFDLTLPDLKPFAALGHTDLSGHTKLHLTFALPTDPNGPITAALDGGIGLTDGLKQAVGLIGNNGTLSLAATMTPQGTGKTAFKRLDVQHFTLDGQAIHLKDTAQVDLASVMNVRTDLTLGLTDLTRVAPSLRGSTDLTLHAEGPANDLSARTHVAADFGTASVPRGPLTLDAAFSHLPSAPDGTVTAAGVLDRAPLSLDAALSQDPDRTRHLTLRALHWNSLAGQGALRLAPGTKVPLGNLDVKIARLADFSRLAGQALGGHLTLSVQTAAPNPSVPAKVALKLDAALAAAQASVRQLQLNGTVSDPAGDPDLDLRLALAGLSARGITGSAQATAQGKQKALALTARAALQNVAGAPANLDTAVLLDLPQKQVRVQRLTALAKGENLRVLAPALVSFGQTMGVDRLRMSVAPPGAAPASVDIAGTFKPKLDVHATIDHVTPALAKPFDPSLSAHGTLAMTAQVTGTLARPMGHVSLTARNFGMNTGPAASLPAANVSAAADLLGTTARFDTSIAAGRAIALSTHGTVPTSTSGPIAVTSQGHVDLSVANAVLGAQAMALTGQVALNLTVTGTAQQPQAQGQVTLSGAEFDDYAQGVRLSAINGAIVASGDTFTFQNFTAHAGRGTIGIGGSVSAFRPNLPVDLHITADHAQPVTSDLLTATLGTDLRIHGQASSRLDVDGTVRIPSATINIPSSMPASVPQLNVIRPGQAQTSAGGSKVFVGLNVNVVSPGQFYVRGHGLDAEMSGNLHVGGFADAPLVSGGFDLVRGAFNLAGINLNFTHGRVGFNGTGVNHKLDPTLDFRADRNAQGTLASLLVTGYASAPKIGFTSNPSLPQEQVLSLLLFGTDSHSLSTTQLAELGAALATLTGGSSFDPLGKVQSALGLDRLAVGGGSGVNNGGTSVEAGKNVMKGVYVGAKQATSGSGTQAQVQIGLTKRLKLNTTVGTGGQVNGFTTPENDPGSSVGLSYGFDY
jgi:translocation and assembly module TamB